MGSEHVVEWRDDRTAGMWRSLPVALFALMWVVASGNVHAATKDASMCAALKGAAKGVCTAAAALGCGEATKHQKQCDALGDKFEALTGDVPPWEDAPPPPPPPPPAGPSVTLAFDVDAFDLELGAKCENALTSTCNGEDNGFINQPNDFWVSFDFEHPTSVVLLPVMVCSSPEFTSAIAIVPSTIPFESVDGSMIPSLEFSTNLIEVMLSPGDTIVLQTCDIGYFKIGKVAVEVDRATLSYDELHF